MPREQKQLSLLLSELQKAGNQGLRHIDIINLYIINYKGRVSDLRHARLNGIFYDIETRHINKGEWRYIYHGVKQSQPQQLNLIFKGA
jgi:hypothetical protein